MDGAFTKEKTRRCKNFISENKLTRTADISFLFKIYAGVLVLLGLNCHVLSPIFMVQAPNFGR